MKTVVLRLAKRYAAKTGIWTLAAAAIAAIFGLETEAVKEWLAPVAGNAELTISGILGMIATAVHWWMDREKDESQKEPAKPVVPVEEVLPEL